MSSGPSIARPPLGLERHMLSALMLAFVPIACPLPVPDLSPAIACCSHTFGQLMWRTSPARRREHKPLHAVLSVASFHLCLQPEVALERRKIICVDLAVNIRRVPNARNVANDFTRNTGRTWRLQAEGLKKKKTGTARLTRERDAREKEAVKHGPSTTRVCDKCNNLLVSVPQATRTCRTSPSARGTQCSAQSRAAQRDLVDDAPHPVALLLDRSCPTKGALGREMSTLVSSANVRQS